MLQSSQSRISGVGVYLPEQKVSSAELMMEAKCNRFSINEHFLERATGIKERRFSRTESLADMAIYASQEAIRDASIGFNEIDLVLYCGIDNDYAEPSMAHEVACALGINTAFCMDVSNACIGLLTGVSVANAYIVSGAAQNVLICTGEKPSVIAMDACRQMSKAQNKKKFIEPLGALTVGDAGGAFVVSKSNSKSFIKAMKYSSFPEHRSLCYYKRHGTHYEGVMEMEKITFACSQAHESLINETYNMLSWTPIDVDRAYCHQVGKKHHKSMVKLMGIEPEKATETYPYFANLTSATHAVNMYFNPPNKGEKILFMGSGSGLSICQIGVQY